MVVVGGRLRRVVGIVADLGLRARSEPLQPYVYTPYDQNPELVDARVCVRVAGDPAAMLPPLVREVIRIDRDVPIAETITLPFKLQECSGTCAWEPRSSDTRPA